MLYKKNRPLNLKKASYIPGADDNYNLNYKSKSTRSLMPSGFSKGEEMHHLVPAELFGAFVQNLPRHEAEIVINRANELGIRVGNDPANFVGLDKMKEHIRNDEYDNTVHALLDNLGLESAELSDDNRKQFYGLLNKIASSDVNTRLKILPDFVTYIAEPAIEIGREFRPGAQGIDQNKKQFRREVAEEAARERLIHHVEEAALALGVPTKLSSGNSQSAKGGEELNTLIKKIRMAGDKINIA